MGSAVIGSLRVVLGIDTGIFDKELANVTKSLKGVGQSMQGIGKSMSGFLTAPILGFAALTVNTAGNFEAAMNRVGAATGAAGTQLEALETLARDLGKTTSKSASEAADMLEMLAKNGLSAEQILSGAADAAIKLSEATGGDLSKSADVATNIMAQFGKEAKDLGPIVDQITGVTLQSQFGFEDYAQAIGQAGGVAGSLGVSLTDFNASIAATSDVFNSGSDAGTSFKTFLLRLVPASEGAAAEMKRLGLEFFDASGKMKSMPAIAQELKEGLAGLSDEARNDALNTIFGTDALRTAVALGNEGAAGVDTMVEAINRKGIADEQAAARMKGFNGEMEKLSGAFDELKLAIADSGLLETITGFVTKLAEWMTELSKTSPEILKWGVIVAGLVAAIGPVVLVVGTLATAIAAVGAPIALAVAGIGLLAAGAATLYADWDRLRVAFPVTAAVIETAIGVVKAIVVGLFEQFRLFGTYLGQLFSGDISGAAETVRLMISSLGETISNLASVVFPGAIAAIKAKFGELVTSAEQIGADLIAAFAALPGQMMEIDGQIMDGLVQGIKNKLSAVTEAASEVGNAVYNKITGFFDINSPSRVMHEVGANIMQGLGNGMESLKGSVVATAAATAGDVSSSFQEAGDSARGVFSGLGSSIGEAIKGTKEWSDVLSDVVGKFADLALQQLSTGMGGGGGGFLSGLLGGLLGFASGGTIMPGGTGGIDSQVVAFRKSPNERVDITKPGQQLSSSGGEVRDVFIRGVFVDDNGVIKGRIEQTAAQTSEDAVRRYDDQMPGRFSDLMERHG